MIKLQGRFNIQQETDHLIVYEKIEKINPLNIVITIAFGSIMTFIGYYFRLQDPIIAYTFLLIGSTFLIVGSYNSYRWLVRRDQHYRKILIIDCQGYKGKTLRLIKQQKQFDRSEIDFFLILHDPESYYYGLELCVIDKEKNVHVIVGWLMKEEVYNFVRILCKFLNKPVYKLTLGRFGFTWMWLEVKFLFFRKFDIKLFDHCSVIIESIQDGQ